MREVTRIHLGRQPFTIAIDANKALDGYLQAIKKQVGNTEVVNEVELRMAELLRERGITGDKAIVLDDITWLKSILGEASDFGDETTEDEAAETPVQTRPKRLFRDTENGMLGGVCAGLGAFFGIDPVLIRIGFVLLTIFAGSGVLIYVILWLIMPEAKTSSDRLQMEGQPVTVGSLKALAKRHTDKPARHGNTVGKALGAFLRFCVAFFGALLILIAAIAIIGIIIGLMYALFGNTGYIDASKLQAFGIREILFVLIGSLAAIGAFALILLTGISMIKRRWPIPTWATAMLFAAVIIGGATGTAMGFDIVRSVSEKYEASKRTEIRQLSAFTKLELSSYNTTVMYEPADTHSVEVRTKGKVDTNALKTDVVDGTLRFTNEATSHNVCGFSPCIQLEHAEIVVHAPTIEQATLTHESFFKVNSPLKQQQLRIITDKDSRFYLSHVYPTRTKVTTTSPVKTIELLGLPNTALATDVIRENYDGQITISRSNEVELETSKSCDADEPLVQIDNTPSVITLNKQVFTNVDDFKQERRDDDRLALNCLRAY